MRFPLTRPIARRRTRQLFDLCAGFVYAQVLQACVQLRVFDILYEGPQTIPALADRLALTEPATRTLMLAAVSLRLASRRSGGRFGLGPLGAAMLGNPGAEAMIQHHTMLYRDLGDPVDLLRHGRSATSLSTYWTYAQAQEPSALTGDQTSPYSALMAASQEMIAENVLNAYRVKSHRRLLDVGGGIGAFAVAAATRAPDLEIQLFDLPSVAKQASGNFAAAGIAGRAEAIGGNFLRDPLPRGADLITLVRIIHDHDDADAQRILASAHAALPPGGALLVAEPMSGTPGALPAGDAYFGFYLMAMGSGRPRQPAEIKSMMTDAGFVRPRTLRTQTPLLARAIVASKPA